MTSNSTTPASEASAVELTETELDQALGGAAQANALFQSRDPRSTSSGDGSVKPAGAQPNGILAALESAIHA